jgi:S-DNA-T family DNA segregation ATPase FtsK/SpoIIIE
MTPHDAQPPGDPAPPTPPTNPPPGRSGPGPARRYLGARARAALHGPAAVVRRRLAELHGSAVPAAAPPARAEETLPAMLQRLRATRPRWERTGFVALLAVLLALQLGVDRLALGGAGVAALAAAWASLEWGGRLAGLAAAGGWACWVLGWQGAVPVAGLTAFAAWFLTDPPGTGQPGAVSRPEPEPAPPAAPGVDPGGEAAAVADRPDHRPGTGDGDRVPATPLGRAGAVLAARATPALSWARAEAGRAAGLLAERLRPSIAERNALARRVGYALLPDRSFDPTADEVTRHAQLLAATRHHQPQPVPRAASAIRVRLDATADRRLLYRVEGPTSAAGVLRTAGWAGVELHDPASDRIAGLLPATPTAWAQPDVPVAVAELVIDGPNTASLAAGVLRPDPLAGFARVMADLDPTRQESATVAVDLLPLTPAERAERRQALLDSHFQPGITDPAETGQPGRATWAARHRAGPSSRPQQAQRLAARLDDPDPLFELQVLVGASAATPDRAQAILGALLAGFAAFHSRAWFAAHPTTDPRTVTARLASGRFHPATHRLVAAREVLGILKPPTRTCPHAVRAGADHQPANGGRGNGTGVVGKLAAWGTQVAERAGLAGSRVLAAQQDRWGWTIRLALRPGTTYADARKQAGVLESALGVRPRSVRVAEDPARADRVVVRVLERDPHAQPLPWPGPQATTISEPVTLGLYEDGEPTRVSLLRQHALVAGMTGSGKSGVLNVAIGDLAACRDVVLWGCDLKFGMELGPWREVFDRDWIATSVAEAEALLDAAARVMEARGRLLAAADRRTWEPTPTAPALVIVIDEQARLALSARAVERLDLVGTQGRALAVTLLTSTQYPTGKALGSTEMRAQILVKVILRVERKGHVNVVLGEGKATSGWRAEEIDPAKPGTFYLDAPGATTPSLARAWLITDHAVRDTAARYRTQRPRLDLASAQAAGTPPARATAVTGGTTGTSGTSGTGPAGGTTPNPSTSESAATQDRDPELLLAEAMVAAGADGVRAVELAEQIGMGRTWVYDKLKDLAARGRAEQVTRGRWRLIPDPDEPGEDDPDATPPDHPGEATP